MLFNLGAAHLVAVGFEPKFSAGYPTRHRIPKNLLFSESEGTDEVQAILCITAPQKTQVNERQP